VARVDHFREAQRPQQACACARIVRALIANIPRGGIAGATDGISGQERITARACGAGCSSQDRNLRAMRGVYQNCTDWKCENETILLQPRPPRRS
jgi:hypothetical protein